MNILAEIPKHQKNGYFLQPSLLIQFVLKEFLRVSSLVRKIRRFLPVQKKDTEKVFTLLSLLGGPLEEEKRNLPWLTATGSLYKLRDYLGTLCSACSKEQKKSVLSVYQVADTFLEETRKGLAKKTDVNRLVNDFETLLEKFLKLLPPLLSPYSGNERVLFFLLCHKQAFSEIAGKGFLPSLFSHWKKQDESKWREQIYDMYRKKGYDQISDIAKSLTPKSK